MSIKPNTHLPLSLGEATAPVTPDGTAAAEIFGRIIADLAPDLAGGELPAVSQAIVLEGEHASETASVEVPVDAEAMLALVSSGALKQEPERTAEASEDEPSGETLPMEAASVAALRPAVPAPNPIAVAPEVVKEAAAASVPQPLDRPPVKEEVVIAGATPPSQVKADVVIAGATPPSHVKAEVAIAGAIPPSQVKGEVAIAGATPSQKTCNTSPIDVLHPMQRVAAPPPTATKHTPTLPDRIFPHDGTPAGIPIGARTPMPAREPASAPALPEVPLMPAPPSRQTPRAAETLPVRPGPAGFLPISLPQLALASVGGQRQKEGGATAIEPKGGPAASLPLAQLFTPAPMAPFELPAIETVQAAAEPIESMIEHQLDLEGDGEWLDQLARDIAMGASEKAPLRFRLNPEHLGSLRVELTQDRGGTAVRLTTETEAARTIIADAQPRLLAEARAQGLRISEAQVDLAGGGSGSADGRRQNQDFDEAPVRTARKLQEDGEGDGKPTPRRSERFA